MDLHLSFGINAGLAEGRVIKMFPEESTAYLRLAASTYASAPPYVTIGAGGSPGLGV